MCFLIAPPTKGPVIPSTVPDDTAAHDPWTANVAPVIRNAATAALPAIVSWTVLVVLTGGLCIPVSFLAGLAIARRLSEASALRRWFPALAALLALLVVGIGDLAGAAVITHLAFGIPLPDAAADLLDTNLGRHVLMTAGVLPAVVAAAIAAADTVLRLSASLRDYAELHCHRSACPMHAPLRPRKTHHRARPHAPLCRQHGRREPE